MSANNVIQPVIHAPIQLQTVQSATLTTISIKMFVKVLVPLAILRKMQIKLAQSVQLDALNAAV